MESRQNIYIGCMLLVGTGVLVYSTMNVWQLVVETEYFKVKFLVDLLIMLLLFVLCRALPVYIANDKTIDVSFVPVVASTMILGLYPTIILFFLSIFFLFILDETTEKYYYLLSRSPKKELFNMSNIILSVFIGGQPLLLMGGIGENFSFPYSILSATVFGTVTISANLILFILYFVSIGKERFIPMFSQTIAGILPNVVSTIPFGIFIAMLLHQENGSYYVLLFILPLLLARYSFKLYLDSHSMNMRIIESLSRAIEAKDKYTLGHSQRVSNIAEQIARAMLLSNKMVSDIKVAALLHDIGKIGIDDHILNKPAALTNEEYEEVKKHPVIGMEIIKDIKLSQTVNDAVLYHHLRYDGSGYPAEEKVTGKVLLSAAILGIADAYDAMTTDRPYRLGMSSETALRILKENAGTEFDPKVVEVFSNLLEKQELSL